MPFEWLNTHLVLPSYWQSKEGVCDPLYENWFSTIQPEIWQFDIAINTMSYSFTRTCRISPVAPGRNWRYHPPGQSSFHLDKSLAELSLILSCQVFPHHVQAVSVRHGCSSNILWHCDLMAQNSRGAFIFLTVIFYVQEQFKNLYGPSSSSFQMFSYVFFKSRIVLKESEEQVRYSKSDSAMKWVSEPLFSA